jgi:adenine-specific DNA-methyltransferase
MSNALEIAQRLGYASSPFFPNRFNTVSGDHFAMLDGRRASFVCSILESPDISEQNSKDWQWSSDFSHHVLMTNSEVQVRSGRDPYPRTFQRRSIETRLEDFVAFLDARHSSALPDVVPFLIREFQELWGVAQSADGLGALTAFLLGLCAADKADPDVLTDETWCRETALDIGLDASLIDVGITKSTIERARGMHSRTPFGLHLVPSLILRHTAGRLFQEAHAVLETVQMGLFGNSTVTSSPNYSPSGAYYTPVQIARMLAEWALRRWAGHTGHLTIADFACGSGVFLTEALRALERSGFSGSIKLIGRDKSPQAITMAKVAIHTVQRDIAGINIVCDISQANAYDAEWPNADIILMNPPFRSWERMSTSEREWVHEVIGDVGRGRPDLSVGFIERAIRSVNPSGVVATLVPAGVLASESLHKWRDRVMERSNPTLVAVLGEHGLFEHALVNVGMISLDNVGHATTPSIKTPLHVAWSSADSGSASKTIRGIRRSMLAIENAAEGSDTVGWSVTVTKLHAWKQRPSWLPGAGALGSLLDTIQGNIATKVNDLFHVRQGIRTGANDVFLRTEKEVLSLPKRERAYFREAVDASSFVNGEIKAHEFLFVPDPKWNEVDDLSRAVPEFFNFHLRTARVALSKRKWLQGDRWWDLARARGWMFNGRPRLLSKRFGLYPAFARDLKGSLAVVQANAWVPTESLSAGVDDGTTRELLTAYWWLLNSRIAVALLREYCPNVAGGQLDLEKKYVKDVPLPNLALQFIESPALQALSVSIRARFGDRLPHFSDIDQFAASAYGTNVSDWNLSGLELQTDGSHVYRT